MEKKLLGMNQESQADGQSSASSETVNKIRWSIIKELLKKADREGLEHEKGREIKCNTCRRCLGGSIAEGPRG